MFNRKIRRYQMVWFICYASSWLCLTSSIFIHHWYGYFAGFVFGILGWAWFHPTLITNEKEFATQPLPKVDITEYVRMREALIACRDHVKLLPMIIDTGARNITFLYFDTERWSHADIRRLRSETGVILYIGAKEHHKNMCFIFFDIGAMNDRGARIAYTAMEFLKHNELNREIKVLLDPSFTF